MFLNVICAVAVFLLLVGVCWGLLGGGLVQLVLWESYSSILSG